ncbi:MAG TPA: hypothetical protein VM513_29525 [Kofleriaceae bacterium]|nr:hypothetical protein [Kofleriaceae bacterium]
MIIELDPPSREAMSDDEYDVTDKGLAPIVPLRPKTEETKAEQPRREGRTYCTKCNHALAPYYAKCPTCTGEKNRLQVDRLRNVIAELKESVRNGIDPERERELVGLLDVYQHPDKSGFLSWLSQQREKASSPSGRGRR